MFRVDSPDDGASEIPYFTHESDDKYLHSAVEATHPAQRGLRPYYQLYLRTATRLVFRARRPGLFFQSTFRTSTGGSFRKRIQAITCPCLSTW